MYYEVSVALESLNRYEVGYKSMSSWGYRGYKYFSE